ncbi:MAG TPA: APC family permease [Gemmatimonadaceae bacterium]|nr:APC family permease [Gemmatimonadaceae bacterium]
MSRLLSILGVTFGIAVAIGNTIGAGILRTPGDVASLLQTPWLFIGVWIVGALYALLGANALAELGTMLPRSGAQYVYARRAFGDYAGFVVGWNDWISTCASTAAIAIVIGESLAAVIPGWSARALPLALATVVVFTALLLRSTKIGGRSQEITSFFKTIALVVFVGACFIFGGPAAAARAPNVASAAPATTSLFVGFVLSAQAVIYTYDGWSGPLYFSEELRDPGRQIPRAMFGSLLVVAAIYLLINLAFLYVLPVSAMAGSPLAAARVAQTIFGPRGDTVVRLVVILALPSAVNACLLMSSRVLYGVSRDGLGPRLATRVNMGGTPTVALIASGVVSLIFISGGGMNRTIASAFNRAIAIAAFFFVADYALSFIAVFVLRRREPNLPRPYRAIGHPWTTGLVLAGSIVFLAGAIAADHENSLWALAVLLVSWPAFLLTGKQGLGARGIAARDAGPTP